MKKSTLIAEFDQVVHTVDSSFPSLYTKDDVIKVLRNLEGVLKDYISEKELIKDDSKILTPEQVTSLVEAISGELSQMGDNIIADYDLSLDYKEIRLDGVELHYDNIYEKVEESISDWFTNLNEDDDDCDC